VSNAADPTIVLHVLNPVIPQQNVPCVEGHIRQTTKGVSNIITRIQPTPTSLYKSILTTITRKISPHHHFHTNPPTTTTHDSALRKWLITILHLLTNKPPSSKPSLKSLGDYSHNLYNKME
jgi:hypothetical protein